MPRCVVRYHGTVIYEAPGHLREHPTVGVVEEEREPDEWGDPGRLVRWKLLRLEGPAGAAHFQQIHSGTCQGWSWRIGERIGPLEWASE